MTTTTKAIVLKSSPFDETGKIISLLSEDLGIIRCLIKAIPAKRLDLIHCSTPFFEGVFQLNKGRNDLYKFIDCTAISYHHGIKNDLERLKTGFELLQFIANSQISNKPIPLIYKLLSKLLAELAVTKSPPLLAIIFYLKILRHEGIFHAFHFCEKTTLDPDKIQLTANSLKFEEIYCLDWNLDEIAQAKSKIKEILSDAY